MESNGTLRSLLRRCSLQRGRSLEDLFRGSMHEVNHISSMSFGLANPHVKSYEPVMGPKDNVEGLDQGDATHGEDHTPSPHPVEALDQWLKVYHKKKIH